MLIAGSIATREETIEIQYISKIVLVNNRIKDIARGA